MKSILKNSKFPFIMSIITFIIGILLIIWCKGQSLKYLTITVFIPFLIFPLLTYLSSHFSNKNRGKVIIKIITGIFTVLLFIYYFIVLLIYTLINSPITNVEKYNSIVTEDRLLKVFPKNIPDNVEKVEFYYNTVSLQGGTDYSLYYVDKNMTKEKLENKYKNKSIWIGHIEEYTDNNGLLSGTFSNTPIVSENEKDFLIYIIEGKCDNSGYCNHGEFLLAAFNEKTKEIIYRSSDW